MLLKRVALPLASALGAVGVAACLAGGCGVWRLASRLGGANVGEQLDIRRRAEVLAGQLQTAGAWIGTATESAESVRQLTELANLAGRRRTRPGSTTCSPDSLPCATHSTRPSGWSPGFAPSRPGRRVVGGAVRPDRDVGSPRPVPVRRSRRAARRGDRPPGRAAGGRGSVGGPGGPRDRAGGRRLLFPRRLGRGRPARAVRVGAKGCRRTWSANRRPRGRQLPNRGELP